MKKLFILLSIFALAISSCTTGGDDLTGNNGNNTEGSTGSGGGDNSGGEGNEGETNPDAVFTISPTEVTNEWDDSIVLLSVECTDESKIEVTIDDKYSEWLFFSGVEDGRLFFDLDKNTTENARTGKAVAHDKVSGKDITITITQLQKGGGRYLSVTPQSVEMESKGGTFEFELTGIYGEAEVSVKLSPANSDDWIGYQSVVESEESSSTTNEVVTTKYRAVVSPNTSAEQRSCSIKFTCPTYDLQTELQVVQKAYESSGEKSYLYYTSTDGKVIEVENNFDAPILSNTYANGKGTITFDGTMTKIVGFVGDNERLETVTIPDNVVEIGTQAFAHSYYNLKTLTIGSGVKVWGTNITGMSGANQFEVIVNSPIGKEAFADSDITKLTCGSGVTSIGESAFEDCYDLFEATFAEGLVTIEKRAFAYTMLVKADFPNSLEVVGDEAFWGSEYLAALLFGNKVKSLGRLSFYGTQVMAITCRTAAPPTYGEYALYTDGDDGASLKPLPCTILVPAASVSRYKSAAGWKAHKDKISTLVD